MFGIVERIRACIQDILFQYITTVSQFTDIVTVKAPREQQQEEEEVVVEEQAQAVL